MTSEIKRVEKTFLKTQFLNLFYLKRPNLMGFGIFTGFQLLE